MGAAHIYAADFETSVYAGQKETEVWAAGICELGTDDVYLESSIDAFFTRIRKYKHDSVIYFHNIKFDGSFILSYLKRQGVKDAIWQYGEKDTDVRWMDEKAMPNNSIIYHISRLGQWYSIIYRVGGRTIRFYDSYKLLPFDLRTIGKTFGTIHQKTVMDYKGERHAGGVITDEEQRYLCNDVLVLKEALEIFLDGGYKGSTIGSCCMEEYMRSMQMGAEDFKASYPDLTTQILPTGETADHFVRQSYRGGWCYLKKGCENRVFEEGITCDYNSMYPSQMHSQSCNAYPVGDPVFFEGSDSVYDDLNTDEIAEIPKKARDHYYFVRFVCEFDLREGYLPFVQNKVSFCYKPNVMLETSDVILPDGTRVREWVDAEGCYHTSAMTLTMSCTDFRLFLRYYKTKGLQIKCGVWFLTTTGLFDGYIDKYKAIKMTSKGAKRQLAKLFLNNLYGKFATSKDSSFKTCALDETSTLRFKIVPEEEKKVYYIPVGAAITSYARKEVIAAAQANYNRFIYADTDSIHCLGTDIPTGIRIHETDFCAWKVETQWDAAIFVRQKTYIEHVIKEDNRAVEQPYYNVKCAGMGRHPKELVNARLSGTQIAPASDAEAAFLSGDPSETVSDFSGIAKMSLSDFKIGLTVPGNLKPCQVPGGVVLREQVFCLRA